MKRVKHVLPAPRAGGEQVMMRYASRFAAALAVAAAVGACPADPEPGPPILHARFDPEAKVIPMPTDVLRDDAAGHLDIPIDDTNTDAEKELFEWMNTMD